MPQAFARAHDEPYLRFLLARNAARVQVTYGQKNKCALAGLSQQNGRRRVQTMSVNERRVACQSTQFFKAQPKFFISRSAGVSERNKIIELIHPKRPVLGACSLVSKVFVSAHMLHHPVRSGRRAANSSSAFWEPIANIVSKFRILHQTHGRPCFPAMTKCQKFRSFD